MSSKGFYDKSKIQTGRTTRMMEYAIAQGKAGRAVYVVFSTNEEIYHIKKDPRWVDSARWLKFETPASLNFCWQTLRAPGMHPNCEILVDHHVIESYLGRALEMLNRFDE